MDTRTYFIRRFVTFFVMALCTCNVMAQYISDIYINYEGTHIYGIYTNEPDKWPEGYRDKDVELNDGAGGDYIKLLYKETENVKEAITDIVIISEPQGSEKYSGTQHRTVNIGGRNYYPASYSEHSGGGNLNMGVTSRTKNLWLYYTKDPISKYVNNSGYCSIYALTGLEVKSMNSDDFNKLIIASGWTEKYDATTEELTLRVADCNEGAGGDYIAINRVMGKLTTESHEVRKIEYKAPTDDTDGNIEHYRCSFCQKLYRDEACTDELSEYSVVIPASGHVIEPPYFSGNAETAVGTNFIADLYVQKKGDDIPEGYKQIIDNGLIFDDPVDLNDGAGGDYLYLCYKTTTDIKDAITDVIVVSEPKDSYEYSCNQHRTITIGHRKYHPLPYSTNSGYGNLNNGVDNGRKKNLWLYYTKDEELNVNNTGICQYTALLALDIFVDNNSADFNKRSYRDGYVRKYDATTGELTNETADCNEDAGGDWIALRKALGTLTQSHNFLKHESVPATCTSNGNIAYNHCTFCERNYTDEYGWKDLRETRTEIPSLGHDWDMDYNEEDDAWNLVCKRDPAHNEVRKQMCLYADKDNTHVKVNYDNYSVFNLAFAPDVYYSLNGGKWTKFSWLSSGGYSVTLNKGDKLWLKGNNSKGFSKDTSSFTFFEIDGLVSASGSVMSLIDEVGETTAIPSQYCFYKLFSACPELTKAPRLTATTLASNSYANMFEGCSKLTDVTLCVTEKTELENAINADWLRGTTSSGILHITDELALQNAALQLPFGWQSDKVGIHAKEDPNNAGDYYATYYDSQNEYFVKEGTKAYTGIVYGDVLQMTAEADNIIPAGEGALLKGNTDRVILMLSDTNKSKTAGNDLTGSDTDTSAPANCYIFGYGQDGSGFYQYAADENIAAHQAYLIYNRADNAKDFRIVFENHMGGGIFDGIGNESADVNADADVKIYNLQGIRQNKLQKGINLVNGKKMIVK